MILFQRFIIIKLFTESLHVIYQGLDNIIKYTKPIVAVTATGFEPTTT